MAFNNALTNMGGVPLNSGTSSEKGDYNWLAEEDSNNKVCAFYMGYAELQDELAKYKKSKTRNARCIREVTLED